MPPKLTNKPSNAPGKQPVSRGPAQNKNDLPNARTTETSDEGSSPGSVARTARKRNKRRKAATPSSSQSNDNNDTGHEESTHDDESDEDPIPDIMKEAYIPLLDEAWEREKKFSGVARKVNKEQFRKIGSHMLASMFPEVVEGLRKRNLPKCHAQGDPVLAALYGLHDSAGSDTEIEIDTGVAEKGDMWREQINTSSPALYARFLVDGEGNPPDLAQKRKIAETILCYVESDRASSDVIRTIDQRGDPQGYDRLSEMLYNSEDANGTVIENRVSSGKLFAQAILRLCDHPNPTEAHAAWTYIGYASNYNKRREQHDAEQSSSFLMKLTKHVAHATFPEAKFDWAPYVVAFLANSQQEFEIGEVLLTYIASAYSKEGTGFAVVPAGQSNKAPTKAEWARYDHFRREHTPYEKNRQIMGEIARADRTRFVQQEDQIRKDVAERDQLREKAKEDIDWLKRRISEASATGLGPLAMEAYLQHLNESLEKEEKDLRMLERSVKWTDSLGL